MSNPEDERRAERNRRILLGAAVVATLAVIAAAVFWYSGSSTSGTAPSGKSYGRVSARVVGLVGASPRKVSTVRAAHSSARAIVLGERTAPVKVVVYEDFGCRRCYEFEEASRDFLHAAAARGRVEVEYRLLGTADGAYSREALAAYGAALAGATAGHAWHFHDLLFDKQPAAGSAPPAASDLADWAKGVGVDADAVSTAVSAPGRAHAAVADTLARRAKFPDAPGVFVDGELLAGTSVTQMVEKLQTRIAGS